MFPYHSDTLRYDHDPQFAQNRMRVLVIGSPKVGKTSLIRRMVDNVFVENPEKPDKFEHSRLTVMARAIEGRLYKLEFQEVDSSVLSPRKTEAATKKDEDQPVVHETVSWLDTHSVLFVYDITSEDSYDDLVKKMTVLQKRVRSLSFFHNLQASPDCNICLVGAKADCKRDRQVPYSKAEQDAELRDISLMEVSSKDGTNISVLFDEIVEYIMERREAQEEFQRTHEMGYLSDQEEVYPRNETIQHPVDEPARPNLFCFWPFGRS